MTVWNKLPIGGGGGGGDGLVFTTLASGGRESGAQAFSYTTTEDYAYVIATAHRTNGTPSITCTAGTQVASFAYEAAGGSNESGQLTVVWKDVPSGSVVTYESVGNRRGYIFVGANYA